MRIVTILLALALAACGNDISASFNATPLQVSTAPQINNLVLSPETMFQMEGGGSIVITAELEYFDVNRDIESMQIEISDGTTLTIRVAGQTNAMMDTLTAQFSVSTAEVGVLAVDVSLVDRAGNRSNVLTGNLSIVYVATPVTWLKRASGLPFVMNDVHWNGWQFLAVGNGGTIMRSPDGVAWVSEDSGTDVDLHSIAWDLFDYLIVGDKGTVLAGDGQNWRLAYKGPDDVLLQAVVNAGFQWVAGGSRPGPETAVLMSSMDHGDTWTQAATLPQTGRSVTDIAWGHSEFVTTTQIDQFGNDSEARVLTSADGLNWVEVVVSTDSVSTHSILYDGNQYWAGGRVGRIYTSPDGINWTEIQTPAQTTLFRAIASTGSTLAADGYNEFFGSGPVDDTGVSTGDGGASWTIFGIDVDYDSRGLAWGNGRFVSVGCAGLEQDCAFFGQTEGAIYSTP